MVINEAGVTVDLITGATYISMVGLVKIVGGARIVRRFVEDKFGAQEPVEVFTNDGVKEKVELLSEEIAVEVAITFHRDLARRFGRVGVRRALHELSVSDFASTLAFGRTKEEIICALKELEGQPSFLNLPDSPPSCLLP